MVQFVVPLTNFDVLTIGLVGDWDRPPIWLADALSSCCRDPKRLLQCSVELQQIASLQRWLRLTGMISSIDPDIRLEIEARVAVEKIFVDVVRQCSTEIDFFFSQVSLSPVFLKGALTSWKYYQYPWLRTVRDIDLLVGDSETDVAIGAARALGYDFGTFDPGSGSILSEPPKTIKTDPRGYEMPRLSKFVKVELSDVACGLLQHYEGDQIVVRGATAMVPMSIEVHYALEPDRRLSMGSEPSGLPALACSRCLTPEAQLVYLCFKAYVDIAVHRERKGVKLLGDLIRLCRIERDKIEWPNLIQRHEPRGMSSILIYVLTHLKDIYGVEIPESTFREGRRGGGNIDVGDFLPALVWERSAMRFEF